MIELKQVYRIYHVGDQELKALDNVNLTIVSGDYLSIMGPSGSGKSTLLNIIGLLDRPSRGQYLLNQQVVDNLNDQQSAKIRRRTIGFVFQSFHLLPRLTAAENIALPLVLEGVPRQEREHRVLRALKSVGLQDRSQHHPSQLSGGQRQRVAIARSTIMQPSVLLADEPTGNLDRKSGKEIIELLEHLNTTGITLLIVTHDPDIGHRAQKTIHMMDGKITSQ